MFVEFVLAGWSSAGIGWLLLAQQLVKRDAEKAPRLVKATGARRTETLSIFKPLPPLGPGGLRAEAAGLESFIAQLDAESELLLGIHEADRGAVAPFLEAMRARYPEARLKPIFRAEPDEVANPKIAWEKFLAPHAGGDLWLWSDADIIVPRRFLRSARAEFAQYGAGMLTFPYVVRKMSSGPALFDALFVNVELYPGVLLLRERGPVDFGLGAAMLFRRDDFQRRIDWQELGGALADDFMLGQRLGPVRVSVTTLETVADADTWREALLHYLRWSKTVAWNRPAGSAARVVPGPGDRRTCWARRPRLGPGPVRSGRWSSPTSLRSKT